MNKVKFFKLKMLLIMLLCPASTILAQRYSKNISCVHEFTNNISQWVNTHDVDYREAAENNCNGKIGMRIADELVGYLASIHKQIGTNGSYTLDTYLNCLVLERKNNISISYTTPTYLSPDKLDNYNSRFDLYTSTVTFSRGNNITKVAKDIFYVIDGKISKIDKYKETKNKKVHVDYSDIINEYGTVGFIYNYGEHFPFGTSLNYSFEDIPFMISLDFGINFDNDKYIIDKVEMTDIMNYKREKKIYDPKFFLTVSPQLYFKYVSIGCGVGFLYMNGTSETANSINETSSSNGGSVSSSITISSSSSGTSSDIMLKPMIRPTIKGFIPLSDEIYLTISGGYDMIFGYKEKNGFNAGIGLQWEL